MTHNPPLEKIFGKKKKDSCIVCLCAMIKRRNIFAGERRVMKTVTTMAAAVNVYDLYNSLVFSPDERSVPSSM